MNKGSKRVTVRLGDEAIDAISHACAELQENSPSGREWTISEFIAQAVREKLNHMQRSRRSRVKFSLEKESEYMPRRFEES